MAKIIISGEDARYALKRGIDILNNTVRVTLGPKGHPVTLDRKFGGPLVIDDGVTIANEIDLPEPFENMGAQLVRQAAAKTNDACGDGTTTSTILAAAIVGEGFKNIAAGAEPLNLKKGIEKATKAILDELTNASTPVEGKAQKVQVATIVAKDPEIGNLIADVVEKVGKDGVITIEESKTTQNETEFVEGLQFDRGYLSPYFITDGARLEAVLEDVSILIYDRKISAMADLLPALERILQVTKNLLIIAEDVEGEALATLVINRLRGTLNVVAVKAPGYGDRRKAMLEDMAILTGATLISEEVGRKLDSVTAEDLGHARRVVSNKNDTTIIEGKGSKKAIADRIKQLQTQIKDVKSDFDRKRLDERQARLSGGVAIIRVGAATEAEMKEKKHRVEDALAATRAAVSEGILPGGGLGLLNAISVLDKLDVSGDVATGVRIVKKAIEEPIRWIANNAGKDGAVIADAVKRSPPGTGYNAETDEFGDMVKMGIIDPTKVVRAALENAASIANMVLITESLVADMPEIGKPATTGFGGDAHPHD